MTDEVCEFCLEPWADHSEAERDSCDRDLEMVERLLGAVVEGLGLTDTSKAGP